MSISTTHPDYANARKSWDIMRDVQAGSDQIKSKGFQYLPATESMTLDGLTPSEIGWSNYVRYRARAIFPEYTSEAIRRYLGRLNMKPATVTVPAVMQPMLERISAQGETVHEFLTRIHFQQLTVGRTGVMVDLAANPNQANPLPILALYEAETVINWDNTSQNENEQVLNLVVMKEMFNLRNDDLSWKTETRYRVLFLNNIDEGSATESSLTFELQSSVYQFGIFDSDSVFNLESLNTPVLRGRSLEQIPFVFINCNTITSELERPPLRALADTCLSIYNSEADYRQSLHMQGQDTLVIIGGVLNQGDPTQPDSGNDSVRVGTGARIEVDVNGDAKYIGVSSSGLQEQREALQYDKKEAQTISGQVVQERANRESGDAISRRVGAQTTTLKQIAQTAAAGLERALRIAAEWQGLNANEVTVTPNLDFENSSLNTQDLVSLAAAKVNGLPLSQRSIHNYLQRQDFTELTFENEIVEMQNETGVAVLNTGTSSVPTGTEVIE